MENIGALSILLAFCLAVFAVVAAVAGKYGTPSLSHRQRGARRLRHLDSADDCLRDSGLRRSSRAITASPTSRPQQQGHADGL